MRLFGRFIKPESLMLIDLERIANETTESTNTKTRLTAGADDTEETGCNFEVGENSFKVITRATHYFLSPDRIYP